MLLFDDPRISGEIKGFVKTEQRMGEGLLSGYSLTQTGRMAYLLDWPFEEKRNDLMMVCVFVGLAEILFRVLVESLLAAE